MARKSKAVKSQGTRFLLQVLSGALVAKNITAISKANPCVVTSAAHGFKTGDVVKLAAIGGTVELNGLTVPIKYLTDNTFALVDIDSTNFGTYTTGGTASALAFVESEQHKTYSFEDPGAPEQDESTLVSEEKEFGLGLPDPGTFSAELHYVEDDAAQIEIEKARADGEARLFKVVKRNGFFKIFIGYVKSFNDTGGVDGRNSGTLQIRLSGKKWNVGPA